MGAHAGHRHVGPSEALSINAAARNGLLSFLAVIAICTLAGLIHLWPHHDPRISLANPASQFAAPGVAFVKAEVRAMPPACKTQDDARVAQPTQQSDTSCGQARVRVLAGDQKGKDVDIQVAPEVAHSGLRAGDHLEIMELPSTGGKPGAFAFFSVDRHLALFVLFGLLVFSVGLVARVRGLLALVAMVFAGYVVVSFMLPALLNGRSGTAVALVGASAIMFVVLYLAHGPSVRTSAALAGTLLGIGLTAGLAAAAIDQTRLTGVSDETGSLLSGVAGKLDFQGLLTCAVIIAGLGILNDVTITQASSVWELRAAAPELGRRRLFSGAMRIGRDHIASTLYTVIFAYAGAALSVLLLLYLYDRPWLSLLSTEQITEEVVRTLVSTIGLVLAVPLTTAIAVMTVPAPHTANDSNGGHAGVSD